MFCYSCQYHLGDDNDDDDDDDNDDYDKLVLWYG